MHLDLSKNNREKGEQNNSEKYGRTENVVRNIGNVRLEDLFSFKVFRSFSGHLLGTL